MSLKAQSPLRSRLNCSTVLNVSLVRYFLWFLKPTLFNSSLRSSYLHWLKSLRFKVCSFSYFHTHQSTPFPWQMDNRICWQTCDTSSRKAINWTLWWVCLFLWPVKTSWWFMTCMNYTIPGLLLVWNASVLPMHIWAKNTRCKEHCSLKCCIIASPRVKNSLDDL